MNLAALAVFRDQSFVPVHRTGPLISTADMADDRWKVLAVDTDGALNAILPFPAPVKWLRRSVQ